MKELKYLLLFSILFIFALALLVSSDADGKWFLIALVIISFFGIVYCSARYNKKK